MTTYDSSSPGVEEDAKAIYDSRLWTKHYDEHVPASMAPYPEHPLFDLLTKTALEYPQRPVLVTTAKLPLFGRKNAYITYKELEDYSNALAAALIDKGLKKGARVAIVMPNCTAFAIGFYAVLKAGGVVAATNPTYPPSKMAYQINDCDAEFVIVLSLFYDMLKQIQPQTKVKHLIVANIKEYMPGLAKFLFTVAKEKKEGHRVEVQPGDFALQDLLTQYAGQKSNVNVLPDDLAIFQYTGGTTGVSKGAMSAHRALTANTYQLQTWTGMMTGNFLIQPQDLVFLGAIPMFHAYGLVALLCQAVVAGGRIVLIPNPRDIDEVIDVIDHFQPNAFLGVPALFNAVNNHPRVQSGEVSLKSIIFNSSGSAPLPPATKRDYESLAGGAIAEGFGMSETPVATHSNPMNKMKINSIGIPLPDTDARIVSLDDGLTPVGVGEVGELIIHAPNLMRGYHNLPTETANTLREIDGKTWLFTGDIARMDEEGYFYIVDRKKDMALIGGFNVYPANIEKVLKEHPAILEVGVASVPHPEKEGQEALKAWVVVKPGMTLTEAELIKHCEGFLAKYEVPRRFAFIDELPKTTVGKTLRRELIRLEMEGS